ncbi:MAG TPA: TIGR02611 family protein [Gaiellaceae bacterium]|nr:TIGR02611 family protein [Gaiellaceae bacterium]
MGQDDAGGRPPLIERIRSRQERHRQRNRIFRVGFAAAGFVVLLLGIVMLFTPGPGWAVIVLGLGMLALEFAWAERLLERVIDRLERAAEHVTKGSPVRRAALIAVGLAALAAVVVMIVIWDIPFFPG